MSAVKANASDYDCGWFALCTNPATHFQSHPILHVVPTCDRCRDRAGLSDEMEEVCIVTDEVTA